VCFVPKRVLSRSVAMLLLGAATLTALPAPASAEGFLQWLFGAPSRPAAPPPPTTPASAYGDPRVEAPGLGPGIGAPSRSSEPGGQYVSYCVRLCDGRYFPIQRRTGTPAAEYCRLACPATQTKIFTGSSIAYASAADGARYDNLDNAYVYREKVVSNCTCNGKDAFGLAPVDVNGDPTLRSGDIVATGQGLMAYTAPRKANGEAANFTPIESYRGLSADLRRQLATTNVAPAPAPGQ